MIHWAWLIAAFLAGGVTIVGIILWGMARHDRRMWGDAD